MSVMRFLLECGHYAIGRDQLVGDRRLCGVCPSPGFHSMNRMIVDVAPVSAELVSANASWASETAVHYHVHFTNEADSVFQRNVREAASRARVGERR